jgi:type II secretion system protein G
MINKWKMKNGKRKIQGGFTLVELLVVITILGILATIGLVAFTSSQARARDAQRKSNLKEISSSLELFYSDYGKYPNSDSGKIVGCSYNPANGSGTDCAWGTGDFTDGKTTYFQALPKDPVTNLHYYYNVVASSSNQAYQLFTYLENSQDQSIISSLPNLPSKACGSYNCNFSVTSANTTPTAE